MAAANAMRQMRYVAPGPIGRADRTDAQPLGVLAMPLQVLDVGDLEVQVHLNRDVLGWPGRGRSVALLLDRYHSVAVVVEQDKPVCVIRAAVGRRLFALSVMQPEELAIELGQTSTVSRIDRGVKQDGIARHGRLLALCPT